MTTSFRVYFRRLFQIKEGEGHTFALLALTFFLIIAGNYTIGRSVSRSLFLSNLPPEYIPYRYLIVTAGVVLATLAFARFNGRFRRDRMFVGSTAILTLGVLAFRILLATPLAGSLLLLGGLYVFLEVIAVLITVQFWTLASELLTSRQAKRLFGPVSAMGGLGGILGGAFVSLFAAPLGTANLLFVVIATQIGCMICVWILGRRHKTELQQKPAGRAAPAQQSSLSQGFRDIRAMPLLLSMAGITIITTMVSNIVDYQFDLTMQANFQGDETTLTSFLGSFYFWAGIIGIIFQMFFSSRLLGHFGLSFGLAVLPLSFALGSTFILATGASLWAVTATRASENVFRYNLNDIAFGLLDLPLSRGVRARSKAVITGILKPVSGGLSGILFLVVGSLRGISPVPWSALVLLLVAIWLFLIRRVRDQYQEALLGSIRRRRFDPATDAIDISDETTVHVLLDSLQQADDAQVLQALSLIAEAPDIDWSSALIPLLDHPATDVRIAALQRLGTPQYEAHADLILQQIETRTGEVRAAAITAFCAIRGAEATPNIAPYLESEAPSVRAAAVVGIIRHTGLDGIIQGSLALKEMLDHPDPAMRRAGADVLGRLEVRSFYQPLLAFFKDPDPDVENQALHAAGKLRHPNLLPGIVACLGTPRTMSAATQALLAYGEESCTVLGEALFASSEIAVCRQIPKVLGRISSPLSAQILSQHLEMGDDYARARVYKALVRLQARGVAIPADPAQLAARLEQELRLAYATAVSQIDLGLYGSHLLLADALATRQRYALDRIFYLLGLLYPQSNMAEIRFSLQSGDPRRRANATELVDATLSRQIKNQLLPLLEGPEERLLTVATLELGLPRLTPREHLHELATGPDVWLAACALYALGENNDPHLEQYVAAALQRDSNLLRETAVSAACRYLPPPACLETLRRQAVDDTYPSVRDYAQSRLAQTGQGATIMPLSTFERVLFLRGVDLFRDISGEDLVHIAQVCDEVVFAPGERLMTQGDIGDCLYILVDGSIKVEVDDVGEINRQGPREVVGEMAIISQKPRSATCIALTDVTALRIFHDDFWDLLAEKPALSMGVIRVLSSRLHQRLELLPALTKES